MRIERRINGNAKVRSMRELETYAAAALRKVLDLGKEDDIPNEWALDLSVVDAEQVRGAMMHGTYTWTQDEATWSWEAW